MLPLGALLFCRYAYPLLPLLRSSQAFDRSRDLAVVSFDPAEFLGGPIPIFLCQVIPSRLMTGYQVQRFLELGDRTGPTGRLELLLPFPVGLLRFLTLPLLCFLTLDSLKRQERGLIVRIELED